MWTVVGSAASVAGVAVAAAVAIQQSRTGRKPSPVSAAEYARVPQARSGGEDFPAVTALRAPTGQLPEHVRGRDELMAQFRVLVERPDGQVHVLAGLGGVGKSTVALLIAEEAAQLGTPAWWVPAGDAGMVTAALVSLAQELGAPPGEIADALSGRRNPADLLWRFLEMHRGWLLIIDNVDDLDALALNGIGSVSGSGWLRPSTSGLIVVTSRISDARAWGRHSELHAVGWLDTEAGAQVLADLAPAAGSLEEAAALSARLGNLPLALHHAGLQLVSDFAAERTFAGYLEALGERFGRLMSRGSAADRAIVTGTWEVSLDALAAAGRPQARSLMRVLSCLAPAVLIPPGMLDLAVLGQICEGGEDGAVDGLAALASVGLIAVVPGSASTRPAVSVHPLVTETSRLHLAGEELARAGGAAVAMIAAAAAGLRHDRPGDWPYWLQLVPHLNAVDGYSAPLLADASLSSLTRVSARASHAFLWAGSYSTAQMLAQSAISHAERLGDQDVDVLSARFQLASVYRLSGKYTEAEQEFRSLLAAELQVLGPDHEMTLSAQHEIARMLTARGRYAQAEQQYRDAAISTSRS